VCAMAAAFQFAYSEVVWTAVDGSQLQGKLLYPYFSKAWAQNKWLLLHAMSHSGMLWFTDLRCDGKGFGVSPAHFDDVEFSFFCVQRFTGMLKMVHKNVLGNVAFAWSALRSWSENRGGPFPIQLLPTSLLQTRAFALALVARHRSTFEVLPLAMRMDWEVAWEAVVAWPGTNVPHVPSPLQECSDFWIHVCGAVPACVHRLPQCVEWDPRIWMEALFRDHVPKSIPANLDKPDGEFVKQFLLRCIGHRMCPSRRLTSLFLFDPTKTRTDEYWLLLLRAARSAQVAHYTLQWMPRHVLHFVGSCLKHFNLQHSRPGIRRRHRRPYWFRPGALAPSCCEMTSKWAPCSASMIALRLVHPGLCWRLGECIRSRRDVMFTLRGVKLMWASLSNCCV
jgi:hypothetical protein